MPSMGNSSQTGQNPGMAMPQQQRGFNSAALPYALMGLGQNLTQAGAPSQTPTSFMGGVGQGAAGFGQGVQQYRQQNMQDELFRLQQEEAEQKRRRMDLEAKKFEQETTANEQKRSAAMTMAQTPPKSWNGDMQSWQNLVLTDMDSAAKWYEPQELKLMTETQGAQERQSFYEPMTGSVVKSGEWAPRWAPQQAAQPNEFTSWLDAFKRDNNRNPTAKEIADRDKRLNDAIEYKNVNENGKVSTLPVGPQLDAAIARGAVITGTTTQLTEAQSKAGMQFAISKQANAKLDKVEQVLTSPTDHIASQFGTIGNYAKSDEYQQAEQAARAMAEMFLRATTGAAATEPEIERVKQTILPQPGNDPGTIAQKKQQRQLIVETLRLMSGSMAGQVEALGAGSEGGTAGPTVIDGYTITPVD